MFKSIEHIAYHFDDVASAANYFIDTFGFERVSDSISKAGFPITYLRLGGMLVELTTRAGGEPMSGFHICLQTDDIEAAAKSLDDRGLECITKIRPFAGRGPEQVGWKRGVYRGRYGEIIEIKGGSR